MEFRHNGTCVSIPLGCSIQMISVGFEVPIITARFIYTAGIVGGCDKNWIKACFR